MGVTVPAPPPPPGPMQVIPPSTCSMPLPVRSHQGDYDQVPRFNDDRLASGAAVQSSRVPSACILSILDWAREACRPMTRFIGGHHNALANPTVARLGAACATPSGREALLSAAPNRCHPRHRGDRAASPAECAPGGPSTPPDRWWESTQRRARWPTAAGWGG